MLYAYHFHPHSLNKTTLAEQIFETAKKKYSSTAAINMTCLNKINYQRKSTQFLLHWRSRIWMPIGAVEKYPMHKKSCLLPGVLSITILMAPLKFLKKCFKVFAEWLYESYVTFAEKLAEWFAFVSDVCLHASILRWQNEKKKVLIWIK